MKGGAFAQWKGRNPTPYAKTTHCKERQGLQTRASLLVSFKNPVDQQGEAPISSLSLQGRLSPCLEELRILCSRPPSYLASGLSVRFRPCIRMGGVGAS